MAVLPEFGGRLSESYVKMIVYYPNRIEHYTTKTKEKSNGWTLIGETVQFEQAPNTTSVKLQIWRDNKYKNDEQLYEENTTLSSMVNRIIFKSSTQTSGSKLLMVSIWRENYIDDNFYFASNTFSD